MNRRRITWPTRTTRPGRAPRALLLAGLLVGLTGCFGPTEYQRASVWNDGYGYEDRVVGQDEYSVVVRCNPRTSMERAARIALLRAAHLTLENGHERFEVLDQETAHRAQDIMTNVAAYSSRTGAILVPVNKATTREPVAVLLVRMVPADHPLEAQVLDARQVVADIEPELE